MDNDRYLKLVENAEKEKNIQIGIIREAFAQANRKASIGDVVSSDGVIIQVSNISAAYRFGGKLLLVRYYGPQLTKALNSRKDETSNMVYQDGDFKVILTKEEINQE